MSDLAMYTSEQLIQELMSRDTFAGVVIRSTQEVKFPAHHKDWQIAFKNLNLEQVHVVLKEITELVAAEIG